MTTPKSEQLVELESRVAFMERLVDQLNEVILKQHDRMDAMSTELKRLRVTMDTPQDAMPANEKPPHY